jgi:hypothetical protein
MIVGGMFFPLPRLVQAICENGSSSSLPTPVSPDALRRPDLAKANRSGSGSDDLVTHLAKLLPTPTTRDYKDTPGMALEATGRTRDDQLPRRIYADDAIRPTGGMRLTPEFLCWLMGFPPDWLKPLRDVPATQLCRKSSSQSQGQSVK